MPVKQMSVASKVLKENKDFDLVVIGPPFKDQADIEHPNIFVINEPEDIALLFKKYQPIKMPIEQTRKLRPLKAEVNFADAKGRVLLITTDKTIVDELRCFDIRVATNTYSAKRLLISDDFDLAVIDAKVDFKSDLPTYKWDIDVLNKKDVYLLLTTGRLSLETTES